MYLKRKLGAVIGVVFINLTGIGSAQSLDYEIVKIDLLSECYENARANDINDNSQVGGNCSAPWVEVGYIYTSGTLQKVSESTTYSYSVEAINDSAHVIGYRTSVLTDPSDYLYDGTDYVMLEPLGMISAMDINNSDQITGTMTAYDGSGNSIPHACLYDGGILKDIGTLGGSTSAGSGINDRGQITGYSTIEQDSDIQHAFVYDPDTGIMQDIGTLGGPHSRGMSINDNGDVTGYSDRSDGSRHAFIYSDGVIKDIGTLGGRDSYGSDINNSGHIVGHSQLVSGEDAAFFYDGEYMFDLCDLTNCTAYGWCALIEATGINDRGDISGYGFTDDGDRRAFLILADAQPPPPSEDCDDGVDNDNDGLIDCDDGADCGGDPACVAPPPEPEICNDGIDNDGDGLTDCLDRLDCRRDPVCKKGGGGKK